MSKIQIICGHNIEYNYKEYWFKFHVIHSHKQLAERGLGEGGGVGSTKSSKQQVKRNPKQRCELAWKCGSITTFRLCMVVSVNIYATEILFCFKLEIHWVQSSLFTLSQWRTTKAGLWHHRHLYHTCLSCLWHHRNRWTATKWLCSQPCFHNFQMLFIHKLDHKSTEKLLWVYSIPFLSIATVVLLHLVSSLTWVCCSYASPVRETGRTNTGKHFKRLLCQFSWPSLPLSAHAPAAFHTSWSRWSWAARLFSAEDRPMQRRPPCRPQVTMTATVRKSRHGESSRSYPCTAVAMWEESRPWAGGQ